MDRPEDTRPIFVVDDDPDVGVLMKHILRKSGVQNPLRVWYDSRQALADWSALEGSAGAGRAELPLFVLVDLKMPVVGGLELLSWLRGQPHLGMRPRIIMTSSMDRRDAEFAYSAGANGFLTKYPSPFVLAAIARFAGEYGAAEAGQVARFAMPR